MKTAIQKHRITAFQRQSGRCFYCGLPMWQSQPEVFAQAHGLTLAQVKGLQCTAEHLHARCDGGKDKADNIVAACSICNRRRHAGKKMALSPMDYAWKVNARIQQMKWHDLALLRGLAGEGNSGAGVG
ncbi:MAG: HNH endonuclease signature motif containing protein [Fluviicoccus sp.]|uniref:HNH endonuclease n=1 Tax=Fluviicoccus sp. TaxID=2003552 RepID=UPI00271F50B1|nr:HNH endonuclease signature motif containing protein [Fluviicoccus sp.]MDO8328876.1 HNH endonuclease signature motif containing protein [Fluviicoccus sp.]